MSEPLSRDENIRENFIYLLNEDDLFILGCRSIRSSGSLGALFVSGCLVFLVCDIHNRRMTLMITTVFPGRGMESQVASSHDQ